MTISRGKAPTKVVMLPDFIIIIVIMIDDTRITQTITILEAMIIGSPVGNIAMITTNVTSTMKKRGIQKELTIIVAMVTRTTPLKLGNKVSTMLRMILHIRLIIKDLQKTINVV
ncbi:hypothetical protein BD560DRAFT_426767 [Blakeslea trispora]|nr:hypothetical protein BD560DRAFT_426767 [Blakeslea trispora]